MNNERGDTLIEVLIATAILAAAVVGGLGIMNFGFGVILNAVERTQVQAAVTSQISLARFARDEDIRDRAGLGGAGGTLWNDILARASTNYSTSVCNPATGAPAPGNNPFYINEDGSAITTTGVPTAPTGIPSAGNGLWVEAHRPTPTTSYVDIYVKACWIPAAGSTAQEAKSVVRLYVGQSVASVATPPVGPVPPVVVTCSTLSPTNHIANGNFSASAGSGPGILAGAGFQSDLPNRGPDAYPDDYGVNGATPNYTGGFSIQNGEKFYSITGPPSLHAKPFPGDVGRGVAASNTYFYSNPNQRADQPPMSTGDFVGVLWRQTVTGLAANATYDFTAYIDNVLMYANGANPRIQLLANGTPLTQLQLDGVPTGSEIEVPLAPDSYRRVSLLFTTGPTQSSAVLEVFDNASNINGDDFAMTAMALRRCIA